MKPFDEIKHLQAEINAENRQATLNTLLLNQIQVLERIIETNGNFVKDAMAYNTVAGLLDQLKFWVPSIYVKAEENLKIAEILKPYVHNTKPQFGEAS